MRKHCCKRADFATVLGGDVLAKSLKLLAIPAGFEPATIGLEGPKQNPEFCGFATHRLQFQTAFSLNNPGAL